MKRNLTLTGSILGVIGSSIATIVFTVVFFALLAGSASIDYIQSQMPEGYEITMATIVALAIVCFIFIIVCIFGIVFNAKTINTANLPKEEFKAKKGVIVTAIVLDFILCLFVYATAVLLCAAVLILVDLTKEKDRVESVVTPASANNNLNNNVSNNNLNNSYNNFNSNNANNTNANNVVEPVKKEEPKVPKSDLSALETDLNALKDLFDKSLLTSEEYEKLRAERINRHLNNLKF